MAGGGERTNGMTEQGSGQGARVDAVALARAYYLDEQHQFGCAETAFMVLKAAYGLDDPMDPAAAVALNGGVGYSGGMCGAITGAALAVGMLAERRIDDHATCQAGGTRARGRRRSTRSATRTARWTAVTSSAVTCAPRVATMPSWPAASGGTAACGRSSSW